jgi:hypothetical protein
MLDIDRPGRRIMMGYLRFVMAIGIAAGKPAVVVRQGQTGTDEQDKRNNK